MKRKVTGKQLNNKAARLMDKLTNYGEWEVKTVGLFSYFITTKSNKQYNVTVTQIKDNLGIYKYGAFIAGKPIIDVNKQNPKFPDLEPHQMFVESLNKALEIIKSLE